MLMVHCTKRARRFSAAAPCRTFIACRFKMRLGMVAALAHGRSQRDRRHNRDDRLTQERRRAILSTQ